MSVLGDLPHHSPPQKILIQRYWY